MAVCFFVYPLSYMDIQGFPPGESIKLAKYCNTHIQGCMYGVRVVLHMCRSALVEEGTELAKYGLCVYSRLSHPEIR